MTTTQFQLNTQMTTDISLIGLRQNAWDKPRQNNARQFKEAWRSSNKQTFNRHFDILLIYLQLKRSCRSLIHHLS